MTTDPIRLEETRLSDVKSIEDYPDFHERHRVFPTIFENRQHKRILDVAAGVGCTAQRISEQYAADLLCNDITPKCLDILHELGLATVSFDLDKSTSYPFPDNHFDAVISLSTIEHLINIDHFVKEIYRILKEDGYLYISSPNYASLSFFPRFVIAGRSFHDPISKSSRQRYEFYAHVRYFTYRTLLEFVSSFGLVPDTVYMPLPAGSSRYQALYVKSKFKALTFRYSMWLMYTLLSPRWASEPVICFKKTTRRMERELKKVVL